MSIFLSSLLSQRYIGPPDTSLYGVYILHALLWMEELLCTTVRVLFGSGQSATGDVATDCDISYYILESGPLCTDHIPFVLLEIKCPPGLPGQAFLRLLIPLTEAY